MIFLDEGVIAGGSALIFKACSVGLVFNTVFLNLYYRSLVPFLFHCVPKLLYKRPVENISLWYFNSVISIKQLWAWPSTTSALQTLDIKIILTYFTMWMQLCMWKYLFSLGIRKIQIKTTKIFLMSNNSKCW